MLLSKCSLMVLTLVVGSTLAQTLILLTKVKIVGLQYKFEIRFII